MKKLTVKQRKILVICVAAVVLAAMLGTFVGLFVTARLYIDLDTINPVNGNVILMTDNETGAKALAKVDGNGAITDEEFKILVFTDLHFGNYKINRNKKTMDLMLRNIEREKPDLVILTGDIILSSFSKNRVKTFAEVMEKTNVFWAYVLGNHESDGSFTYKRDEYPEVLSQYPHCLMPAGQRKLNDGTEVWGNGNYYVNILGSEGNVRQTLFFMDSGNLASKADRKKLGLPKGSYDFIKDSQIKWYRESLETINKDREEKAPSMVFMHIPLVEYDISYKEALAGGEALLTYGAQQEPVYASDYNSGLFDALVAGGSTKAVFAGHDHVNNSRVLYKGIMLCYVQPSSYNSYDVVSKKLGDKRIQGCTILKIDAAGEVEFGQNVNAEVFGVN